MMTRPELDADIKVGRLLESYPELEGPLMAIAPEFRKLKNPVLRKTIARITSLRQAASIAGMPADELVNRLRIIAGLTPLQEAGSQSVNLMGETPQWIENKQATVIYDASDAIRSGEMPLARIMEDLEKLTPGQVYQLITPLLPAPLLEKARAKGMETWSKKESEGTFYSYIMKNL